ncbi:hypothetical protein JL720_8219 [Aureococcus anophagefferens]|nr:hypothetical protein JL720_8219 [Aureococcus anophagefferens]
MTRPALRRACLLLLAHHALALVAPPQRPRRATSLALSDYVPTPVDPAVVAQQLGVIGASGGAAYYWWTVTVPQKRLESKFNSGDNPIIAAAALILAFGVANALGERAFDVAQRV